MLTLGDRTTKSQLCAGEMASLGYDQARAKLAAPGGSQAHFSAFPTRYLAEQAAQIRGTICETQGLKLRVSAANPNVLSVLGGALPLACDLTIFSPAPVWPSCDLTAAWPCREFASSICSLDAAKFSAPVADLMAWFGAFRSLIDDGCVAYLPLCGGTEEPSRKAGARTDAIGDRGADDHAARRRIVTQASRALNDDFLISQSLGAVHTLAVTPSDLVGLTSEPTAGSDGKQWISRYDAIRLPYVTGVTAGQLREILGEAGAAVTEMRRCMRAVVGREPHQRGASMVHGPDEQHRLELGAATETLVSLLRKRLACGRSAESAPELSWLTLHIFARDCCDLGASGARSVKNHNFRSLAHSLSHYVDLPDDSFFSVLLRS